MTIIDHDGQTVQPCCEWEPGREQHHDSWLGRLRRLNEEDRAAFTREFEMQSEMEVLPEWMIPSCELLDFVLTHDHIKFAAIELAEEIVYLSRNRDLPLMMGSRLVDPSYRGLTDHDA